MQPKGCKFLKGQIHINNSINLPAEVWKEVPNFKGYEVSNLGRVRSYLVRGKTSSFSSTAHILKSSIRRGYAYISLMQDSKALSVRINRLVLIAFEGPAPEGKNHARHLSGNSLDNRLDNLAWGSAKDNYADSVRHGTAFFMSYMKGKFGQDSPLAKLTDAIVEQIKLDANAGMSQKAINAKYGYSNVSTIVRGLTWSHVRPDLNIKPRFTRGIA